MRNWSDEYIRRSFICRIVLKNYAGSFLAFFTAYTNTKITAVYLTSIYRSIFGGG